MRPAEVQDFVADILKNHGDVQRVQTLADVGETKHPYGLVLTMGGRETRWQIIGQLAEGAKHDVPTPPVEGQPATAEAAPSGGAPDAWLAGVLATAESPEIRKFEVWSAHEGARPDHVGVTIFWHNDEKTFVRKI
ncbi:hypothetical protein [Streptomyces sp. G45]|uniref:hypothetical protein n=1 Tax=Streptomyces sp. G45 TaxID=3406627 RepID=UPI003C2AA8E6